MSRLTKTSLFGFLGLTVAFAGTTDLLACGRGGGGGYRGGHSGGYGGSFSRSYAPSYSQPSYHHQPVYQQPVRPIVQQQPVRPIVQQQPVQTVQQQPVQTVQQPQQGFQQQTVAQQRIQQQPGQPQNVQQQPAQSQPVQSQPAQTAQAQPQQAQPQQTQPQQTQPQQTTTQPAQTQAPNAQQSALDILASFEGADATVTTSTTPAESAAFTGIGTWSASLTNGSTVTLQLDADGTFTWTAIKSGKTSTFSGTYLLNGASLTLTRTDNQKLTGALLAAGTNGFTFKLDGVKDNGLQFARS